MIDAFLRYQQYVYIQLQEKQTEEGKGNRIHIRVSFYLHSCDIVWLIFLCVRT